jgi:hypothetical protein
MINIVAFSKSFLKGELYLVTPVQLWRRIETDSVETKGTTILFERGGGMVFFSKRIF